MTARGTDVLFAPFYARNPYQSRLAKELAGRGVHVRGDATTGKEARSLDEALRAGRPDLLHLHWLHPYFLAGDVLRTACRGRAFLSRLRGLRAEGVPIVWTAHNVRNHDGRFPRIDHRVTSGVARLADAIVAHGETARAAVASDLGEELRGRIRVVPHAHYVDDYPQGCDRAAGRRALGLDDRAFVFLFLGRVRAYKGVFELLDAFAAAGLPPSTELIVAGKTTGDRERVRLKRRCKKARGVTLHYGHVEDERLQEYFAAADACVLPYRDVLTSGAAVLAMSFGKPVVAPRVGGLEDVLDDDGAFLYDPDRGGALEDALAGAASTPPDRLAAMGARNRRRAEAWSPSRVASLHAEVYEAARAAAASR